MKKLLGILLITLSFAEVSSQTPIPFFKKNRKYIFVDSVTMQPVNGIEFEAFDSLYESTLI